MTLLWGIDLGGTKIEGAVMDPARPTEALVRLRHPTESTLGYDHVVNQIERVITDLEAASNQTRPDRIGIGTPGTTEPSTGLIKNSNTLCLNGQPLRSDLERRLGVTIAMANDANCFALAEATLGAAQGEPVVMGLILGTGVGGGVVVNGRVLGGHHGIAGEWGHNTLPNEFTPCYCGKQGCNETVFSGTGLEKFYNARTGNTLRLPEIVARAANGDPHAVATLDRLRAKFAEAIAYVINLLDPDAIVPHVFNPEVRTRLLKPALGDSAGVFGAAMLTVR